MLRSVENGVDVFVIKLNKMKASIIDIIDQFAEIERNRIKVGDLVYCQQNGDEPREVIELDFIKNEPVIRVSRLGETPSLFITLNGWYKNQ